MEDRTIILWRNGDDAVGACLAAQLRHQEWVVTQARTLADAKAVEGTPFCPGVAGISSLWRGNVGADAHDQPGMEHTGDAAGHKPESNAACRGPGKQLAPPLGGEALTFERRIDSQISRLRKKIERDPGQARVLKTVWVRGYVLAADMVPA